MPIVVTVVNEGARFWLRGTTWAFSLDRADRFPSVVEADLAIERAYRFNKAKVMRRVELWSEEMALKAVAESSMYRTSGSQQYKDGRFIYGADPGHGE
jgi:hypothetical protein